MKVRFGWRVMTLDEICSGNLQTGPFGSQLHADEYVVEGVPVVMPRDIVSGRIIVDTTARVPQDRASQLSRHRLHEGDVVFSRRGDVARAALVSADEEGYLCGTGCLRARPNKSLVYPLFLNLLVQATATREWLKNNSVGQTMPNMNTEILSQLTFRLPPLSEQRIIANAISTWDAAVQKTEHLITAKERRLAYLRELLLRRPQKAFVTPLRAVTHEVTRRNETTLGREAIMAVTKQVGMRPMREETIAPNIERYKLVPPGAFAYNPMRLNIGSIAISPFARDVLVSPDYVVFTCDESKLLPRYLDHLRHSQSWKNYFELAGNGSVRVRIYYDDLGAFSFPLPTIAVQTRVVKFLDAAAQEVALLYQQAEALRRQKRGLMQKLLTGQWRLRRPEQAAV
jgi:type I restriction enzyme, S subunit